MFTFDLGVTELHYVVEKLATVGTVIWLAHLEVRESK